MMVSAPRALDEAEARTGRHAPRPRIEGDREAEILEATLELLANSGYDRLTLDAVSTAAKASKATLYRRWDSKAELVVDALSRAKGAPQVQDVDTGSLRGDLLTLACAQGGFSDGRVIAVMAAVITALHRDQEFADLFHERFLAVKLRQAREIYERAQQRGEIAPDADLELITSTLTAIILHRAFVLRLPVDESTVERIIDHIVIPAATYGVAPLTSPPGDATG